MAVVPIATNSLVLDAQLKLVILLGNNTTTDIVVAYITTTDAIDRDSLDSCPNTTSIITPLKS